MLIDGKKIAQDIQAEIEKKVAALEGRKPGLSVILVGDNPASHSYVRSKRKACASVGMISQVIELSATLSQADLLKQIERLNRDPSVDGILVQLPLPPHIEEKIVTSAIDPCKDVDGFHPINVGKMLLGEDGGFFPCTPLGIKVLLERAQIPVEGKHVVIVGRSNIVGKPLAALLMQKKPHCNATVTVVHSHSEHLIELTRSADILVAAIGRPLFLKKEMVRPGAVVIDVGINRLPDGKLVGDVDFFPVSEVASHITPVPGGIGPMTIAMLLQNTLQSFLKLLLLLFFLASCQKETFPDSCTHFEGKSSSLPYHVIIGNPLKAKEKKAVEKILASTFGEVDALNGEISQLNGAPSDKLIPLSPSLQKLLLFCEEIATLTGGRFDPTHHLSTKNGIFKKDSSTLQIDLFSLTRGLCVDWLADRLQELGFTDLFVEWAGEIRAMGHHPLNGDWRVPVNPALLIRDHPIAPFALRNAALSCALPLAASSPVASAVVIAPSCALAHALAATALEFPSRKEAESWAQEVVDLNPNVSFWILSHRRE